MLAAGNRSIPESTCANARVVSGILSNPETERLNHKKSTTTCAGARVVSGTTINPEAGFSGISQVPKQRARAHVVSGIDPDIRSRQIV